ncbi:MAG: branched-chain amino acid ABC transporter permease [Halanaeroarchaeum sp.]
MTATKLSAPVSLDALSVRHWLGLFALVALALAPIWTQLLYAGGAGILLVRTLTGALFFGMFAMSWDVVSGYTGQISFGHSLFFAVGGYASALLNQGWNVPPAVAVLLATGLAVLAGLLIGVPALRLEGPYLSLVTLVAPLILLQIFIVYSDIFGGELGVSNPEPIVSVAGGFRAETVAFFYVALGLFVFILALLLAVTRSDAGSVFTAIREDEQAVAAAGLNPAKFKTFAFVLSAAVGGLAGAVFVHTVGSPSPSQLLVMTVSIEVIIAAIVGGMGTIVGAAVGGIFLDVFREWLGNVSASIPGIGISVADLDLFLFSAITLLILFVLPGGILRWGILRGRSIVSQDESTPVTDGGSTPLERTLESYRDALGWDEGDLDE